MLRSQCYSPQLNFIWAVIGGALIVAWRVRDELSWTYTPLANGALRQRGRQQRRRQSWTNAITVLRCVTIVCDYDGIIDEKTVCRTHRSQSCQHWRSRDSANVIRDVDNRLREITRYHPPWHIHCGRAIGP